MGDVSVTYKPTSGACVRAFPGYRGAPVRRDALDLHASCAGFYDGIGPVGPYEPGCPCMCECHAPEGLPAWMRPQEGAALEEALAKEARIRAMTGHLTGRLPGVQGRGVTHDSPQGGYKLILVPEDDTEPCAEGTVYVRWDLDDGRVLAGPFKVAADVGPDRKITMSRLFFEEQVEVIG